LCGGWCGGAQSQQDQGGGGVQKLLFSGGHYFSSGLMPVLTRAAPHRNDSADKLAPLSRWSLLPQRRHGPPSKISTKTTAVIRRSASKSAVQFCLRSHPVLTEPLSKSHNRAFWKTGAVQESRFHTLGRMSGRGAVGQRRGVCGLRGEPSLTAGASTRSPPNCSSRSIMI
jgi:hypothetical protein